MGVLQASRRGSGARSAAVVAADVAIRSTAVGSGGVVNKPAGAVQDDLVLAIMLTNGGTTTVPSGWTLIGTSTSGSFSIQKLYAKILGAGEPSTWTFTDTVGINNNTSIAISGAHATLSNHKVSVAPFANGTSVTTVSIPDALINSLPIQIVTDASGNLSVWSWPSGATKFSQAAGAYTHAVGRDDVKMAAAGATPTRVLTSTNFATRTAFTVAVAPA